MATLRRATARSCCPGPVDDAEADCDRGQSLVGDLGGDGVTADLWRRDETTGTARAFVSVGAVLGLGAGRGMGCGGGAGMGMGTRAAGALRTPPSSSPPSKRCRRPTTSPTSTSPRKPNQRRDLLVAPLHPSVPQAGARRVRPRRGSTRSSCSRVRSWCSAACKSGVLEGSDEGAVHRVVRVPRSPSLADWLLTWAYTRYTGRTAERLLFALRIRIFSHLQRLALDYYDREMAGRIMTRMTTDVEAFVASCCRPGSSRRSSAS